MILVPTRELATQIYEVIRDLGNSKVKAFPIYGGVSINNQITKLENGINIIIGTPGRIIDLYKRIWVQAAELFNEIVVPCENYCSGGLYALGIDIVKEAEKLGCRAVYQRIPGMYNVKLISGDDYSEEEVDKFEYSKTINSIKAWFAQNEDRI